VTGRLIGRTIDDLRDIALDADDAAGFFPALYVRVTERIAVGIRDGRFDEPERMARLVDAFAARYIGARTGRIPVPACWQASWDVAGDDNLLIVQHLLLGASAHINHDLPEAVAEVAPSFGGLEAMRGDFAAVNDILVGSFTSVLRDLDHVERWASEAAALGGGRMFNVSLRVARREAWHSAERLDALDEAGRCEHMAELDRLVTVLAYLITRPVFPLGVVVWLARHLELHDARTVTRALLGIPSMHRGLREATRDSVHAVMARLGGAVGGR
jgi:hypothetical protein